MGKKLKGPIGLNSREALMSLKKISVTLVVFLGIQIANQLVGLFGLPGFMGVPYALSRFITPFFYAAYYAALILFVWRVYRLLQTKAAASP